MANVRHHRALWRNPHTWYITAIMIACTIFYYLATIIELMGWPKPGWGILYTVHDLHRLLFFIPALYAAYIFRLRGVIVIAVISLLIFLPHAIFISHYPEALLRPIVFLIVFSGVGILVSRLLDNITKRKQAEQALRESEEKYRGLITNIKLGVFRSTPEPFGKFLEVNPAMEEITGYRRKKLLQMNVADLYVNPEERGLVLEEVALAKGKTTKELRLRKKDGTEIVVLDRKVAVKDNTGKILYFDGIMEDITERKQAEEREKELQQELSLSSRLASIGELAAGVAHEINNPLTGIMGFSERLLRKTRGERSKQYLQRIYDEAQRAAKVVENLRTFARRREPKKEYSDINDIMQKALELRAYELKTSNIQVILDLAPTLPMTMVDFHQMQEVFLNLILNAEQAISDANLGGNLSIKTQPIKDYIRISFADDGPGIPADQREKIFNPFFTTRGEKGGTGLGLSICHGIVAQHNGRIYVKSRVGKGATFFVELPVTTEEIDEGK